MTNLSTLRNAIQQFDTNLFTPYAVGFDRTFDRLFDYATHQATSTGFPPYNIAKDGDYTYTIEMALAGFSKKDIEGLNYFIRLSTFYLFFVDGIG